MIQYNSDINYTEITDDGEVFRDLVSFLEEKGEGSLTDYILEFCNENDYMVEEVADIIKSDSFMKQILEIDCINHRIFRSEKTKIDKW